MDLDSVRSSLESTTSRSLDGMDLAARLYGFAANRGRVVVANVYADWTSSDRSWAMARDFKRHMIEPRLVLRRGHGEAKCTVPLALDTLEALFGNFDVDEFVFVGANPDLQEVIQRVRKFDCSTVLCATRGSVAPDLIRSADHFVPLEDILLLPSSGGGAHRDSGGHRMTAPMSFTEQDVTSLIMLIDRLEDRLDFVGVGYLITKAMQYNAVGPDDIRARRLLFNHLADEGMVEVYKMENKEEGADPVSACRLNRDHERVRQVLSGEAPPEGDSYGDPGPEDEEG